MRGNSLARWLLAIAVLVPLVAVVAIVGFSPMTSPRLVAGSGDDFFTHLHTEKAMANVTVFPGRAGPLTITVELETPDEQPLAANAVSVTLSKPDAGVEPATAQAQRTDDGRWRVAMTAPMAGRWMLRLGIQTADSDNISVEAPILIK
jgi:copper transport protein